MIRSKVSVQNRAAAGQRIQIGGAGDAIVEAAETVGALLIGHYHNDICHDCLDPCSCLVFHGSGIRANSDFCECYLKTGCTELFTTRQINVFRAVMSTGSVTSAANRLNLSQPSVSRLLRELEEQFGSVLFIRRSKGVVPTPEAQLFLEEIERRYGVLATLEEVAHEISHGRRGILNFGTIPAFSFGVVPRALARIGVCDSAIALNWRVRSSPQLLDWAMAGHLNLGLGYVEGELAGVRVVLRKAAPYMCLLPVDHRKSKAWRAAKLSDLAKERVIALVGVTADIVQARRIGLKHHSPIVAEMSFAAAALAQQSCAVAIVDPFSAEWFASCGIAKAVPLTDIPPYEFALFEPIGARSSILCKELQTILVEEIESALKRVTGASPISAIR